MSEIQDEAYSEALDEIERLKARIWDLEKLNQMTDEEVIMELKAEIERLKAEVDMQIRIGAKILRKYSATQSLLTRAADALEKESWPSVHHDYSALIADLRKLADNE